MTEKKLIGNSGSTVPPFLDNANFTTAHLVPSMVYFVANSSFRTKIFYSQCFYVPFPSNRKCHTQRFAVFPFNYYSKVLKCIDGLKVQAFEQFLIDYCCDIINLRLLPNAGSGLSIKLVDESIFDTMVNDQLLDCCDINMFPDQTKYTIKIGCFGKFVGYPHSLPGIQVSHWLTTILAWGGSGKEVS